MIEIYYLRENDLHTGDVTIEPCMYYKLNVSFYVESGNQLVSTHTQIDRLIVIAHNQ